VSFDYFKFRVIQDAAKNLLGDGHDDHYQQCQVNQATDW